MLESVTSKYLEVCPSRRMCRSRLFFFVLPVLSMLLQPSGRAGEKVELRCKISSRSRLHWLKRWNLSIRKSTGEPVEIRTAVTGESVHFGDLEPGIYTVCVSGSLGRRRCESVDLYPGSRNSERRFEHEIKAPEKLPRNMDLHRVSLWKLQVPDEARRELNDSLEAQQDGDYETAVEHLEKAVKLYPSYVDAWNNLGVCYHLARDYEQAIDHFERAITIEPQCYAGWLNMGGSLLALQEFDEALEATGRAAEIRPGNPKIEAQLGRILYYQHKYERSKRHYQEVLRLDPAAASEPQLYLASIAFALNRREEGIDYIRDYLEIHPNSPKAPRLRKTVKNLTVAFAKGRRRRP